MSVPLDRLYHYIERVIEDLHGDNFIIYRFVPHGSKKLEDLAPLNKHPLDCFMMPHVYCHDQEPLCFDDYEQQAQRLGDQRLADLRQKLTGETDRVHNNFRNVIDINNLAFLIHSEKNSTEVQKYQDQCMIPVYFWSHAVIARDWYRYAQHLDQKKSVKKTFLIYNRAWAGSREYRLKFIEMLIANNLANSCQTTVNSIEPELKVHYDFYTYKNPVWKPTTNIDHVFSSTKAHSCSSADFEIKDYENTHVEVVLETLFDDSRLHLTEKSLRPIACGQPFILASTCGSLAYLRQYGFKTFSDVWNEDYDLVQDPQQRMIKIQELMQSIQGWSEQEKSAKFSQAQDIANYNKQYFFSDHFQNYVYNELRDNLAEAFDVFKNNNQHDRWFDRWHALLQKPEMIQYLEQKNSPVWNVNNLNFTITYIKRFQ